jgi:hypothetical protein
MAVQYASVLLKCALFILGWQSTRPIKSCSRNILRLRCIRASAEALSLPLKALPLFQEALFPLLEVLALPPEDVPLFQEALSPLLEALPLLLEPLPLFQEALSPLQEVLPLPLEVLPLFLVVLYPLLLLQMLPLLFGMTWCMVRSCTCPKVSSKASERILAQFVFCFLFVLAGVVVGGCSLIYIYIYIWLRRPCPLMVAWANEALSNVKLHYKCKRYR